MDIVQHNFDGKNVNQLLDDAVIAGKTIPKGFVNATEMCKAGGKKLNDYTRLKSSIAYLEVLSRSTGIPVDLLIFNNESSGTNEERGTWVHHLLGIDVACWISPEMKFWANKTLWSVINGDFTALTKEAEEESAKVKQLWHEIRSGGKVTRRSLTDTIKDWYGKFPLGSSRPMGVMIALVTNDIYQSLWELDALGLELVLDCPRHESRNYMDLESLKLLERAEANICEYIDEDDIKPSEAIKLVKIRKAKSLPSRKLGI